MKIVTLNDLGDMAMFLLSSAPELCHSISGDRPMRRSIGDAIFRIRAITGRPALHYLSVAYGASLSREGARRLALEVSRNNADDNELYWLRMLSRSAKTRKYLRENVTFHGLEYLEGALARGQGAVLLESPLGNRFVWKLKLLEDRLPLAQVHGPEHGGSWSWAGQRVIRRLYAAAEQGFLQDIVRIQENSVEYIRTLTDTLKNNGLVCAPALGALGRRFVRVDFLGRRQHFATGLFSLALVSGAEFDSRVLRAGWTFEI